MRGYTAWHTPTGYPGSIYGMGLSEKGDIWVPNVNDGKVHVWFGGQVYLDPTSDLQGPGVCRVRVRGAA